MPEVPVPKKEKILIIEGDVSFGEKLRDILSNEGYVVTLIKNGTEGLKAIYDTLPHLLLLDITLPGTDGYGILEKKHAEPLLAKIPVFLLSTQGVPINMRRVPAGSVAEFLVAIGADPADIAGRVNRHFGHESRAAAGEAVDSGTPRKKLLWVEDDKLIGTILSKKLVSSGFDLFHAKNGEEALEALNASMPDAIVLDLLLPGMNGFDILQKVRQMGGRLEKVPVMILSNLSKPSDIERAKSLGAEKFIVKAAVSLDQIVAEVREMIG